MKRLTTLLGAILLLLLVGCAAPATEVEETQTEEPQLEVTEEQEEETEEPTETSRSTETEEAAPTRTPRPTNTLRPTATEESATDVPQPTREATSASTQAATTAATTAPTQSGGGEVVPPGASIWVLDTSPSETGSSDKCPAPFMTDFYGLVRIETIENGVTWMRAQDGITYTLLRQSPNVYWGTGGSIYPGYTLTISVVFASPTGLGVTFVLIDQAVEGCNHYWKYGGTLR